MATKKKTDWEIEVVRKVDMREVLEDIRDNGCNEDVLSVLKEILEDYFGTAY